MGDQLHGGRPVDAATGPGVDLDSHRLAVEAYHQAGKNSRGVGVGGFGVEPSRGGYSLTGGRVRVKAALDRIY